MHDLFALTSSLGAVNIVERQVVILGLTPNTAYQFRVFLGEGDDYTDIGALVIETKTYIQRTTVYRVLLPFYADLYMISGGLFPVGSWFARLASRELDCLASRCLLRAVVPQAGYSSSIGWFYSVCSAGERYDFCTHLDCVSNYRVASTEATVTGLSASQSYELLLLAGRDGETEQVGVRMTATTSLSVNTADNSGATLNFVQVNQLAHVGYLDNTSNGDVPIGIIVGAAVGGLALIVIIIVVVLYVRGRNHVVDRSKAGVVGSMMALVRYFIFKGHVCSLYGMQNMLKSYSDGPGSGDIGGGLEASMNSSMESPAAVLPASASYSSRTYDPHSAMHEQPPEYFTVAADHVDTKDYGKTSLPFGHVGEKQSMENEWRSSTLQPDSRRSNTGSLMPAIPPPISGNNASSSWAQSARSTTMARSNTRSAVGGVKLHSSDRNISHGHE